MTKGGDYCQIASPIYMNRAVFDAADRQFLQDITIHNETYEGLCSDGLKSYL